MARCRIDGTGELVGETVAKALAQKYPWLKGDKITEMADAIDELVAMCMDEERERCAKFVHDRLGADGYGVAKMIREGKHY